MGSSRQVHTIDNNVRAQEITDEIELEIKTDIARFAARGELPHFDDTW